MYDIGESYFNENLDIVYTRKVKIKIYAQASADLGDVEVPYYVKNKSEPETVDEIKGVTYNWENGQVMVSELNRKDIFIEKYNEYVDLKKFTLPNVRAGSVIEYEYTHKIRYPDWFPDWTFQKDIPVVWSEYNARLPPFYDYILLSKGFFQKFDIEEKNEAALPS
ncbi:MAG: DUF3857 domain-containing protein [Bacteroidia bacterium]|nr:DUF3857 domain-containing protein [Bacteroidia bacterium]